MTEIRYEVTKPDPESDDIRLRKQGFVEGYLGNTEVCRCTFGLGVGESRLALTQVDTFDGYEGNGYAEGLIDALREAFPGFQLVDGSGDNTKMGDDFLKAMRRKGKVIEPA